MQAHIETARSFYREMMTLIVRSGYRISIESDMTEWKRIMLGAPATTAVSSMFDPDKADYLPSDAFWLRVSNKNAETIAIICDRIIETDDFVGFVKETGMFAEPCTRHAIKMDLSGKIGHAGGLWVHPKARKTGLSQSLPRLVRALSVIHWGVDRHCGIILSGLHDKGFGAGVYGFEREWLGLSGDFRLTGKADRIYFIDINAEEIARQQALELDCLMNHGTKNLVDFSAICGQGHDQAAVSVPLTNRARMNLG
ncbi:MULTISPECIES: hypothetical protein [Alphaproteobacteria]|uniref:hypothetical protein n=2 Tax=Pseudomonadota TaxID=1224 RepID=UPI003262F118